MMGDIVFPQPCGCVVIGRNRAGRLPLWFIKGQEEDESGIYTHPLAGALFPHSDTDMIREVLRNFCPHASGGVVNVRATPLDERTAHIQYLLSVLDLMLTPQMWHGRSVIFNARPTDYLGTPREVFDELARTLDHAPPGLRDKGETVPHD